LELILSPFIAVTKKDGSRCRNPSFVGTDSLTVEATIDENFLNSRNPSFVGTDSLTFGIELIQSINCRVAILLLLELILSPYHISQGEKMKIFEVAILLLLELILSHG